MRSNGSLRTLQFGPIFFFVILWHAGEIHSCLMYACLQNPGGGGELGGSFFVRLADGSRRPCLVRCVNSTKLARKPFCRLGCVVWSVFVCSLFRVASRCFAPDHAACKHS